MNDTLSQTLLEVVNSGAPGASVSPEGMLVNVASGLVVTITCANFEAEAAPAAIREFVDTYAPVAKAHGLLFGVFQLPSGRYSVDLNIARPESDRERVAEFAHANNQHSYYDARAGACVETGLSGEFGPRVASPEAARVVAALFTRTASPVATVVRRW